MSKLKKEATGLNFAAVVSAMNGGMANIGSYIRKEVDAFLEKGGLTAVPHVFMATHSIGNREWEIEEGHEPAFFEEPLFNGGWYVMVEADVKRLSCVSATSGSSLTAEKEPDGTWIVCLEVPVIDGKAYQGSYWDYFHRAIPNSPME
jgi:hypothetical protein